jgi:hypothetical protein
MSVRPRYVLLDLECKDLRPADVFVGARSGSLSTRLQTLGSIYESLDQSPSSTNTFQFFFRIDSRCCKDYLIIH